MKTYTANIVCNWFRGGQFHHALDTGSKVVNIARNKTWAGDDYVAEFPDGRMSFSFNKKDESFDYIIDMGCYFSEEAKKAEPEQRVLALTEPSIWTNLSSGNVRRLSNFYPKLILGWHEKLKDLKQFWFWNATSKWVESPPAEKQFGISGFISNKVHKDGRGYFLRYNAVLDQHKIRIPSKIYNFTGLWRGERIEYPVPGKDKGMSYMFHLAIENVAEPGYFTEKLVDCFASKVVPVYYGAPDIRKYFDSTGIIFLEDRHITEQINAITPDDFAMRSEAIERNYERSKKYWSSIDSLSKAIWDTMT